MIFVTVGSSLPFDRLVRAVDDVAAGLADDVYAQIGTGGYEPRHMPFGRLIGKGEFDRRMEEATMVVGHAGMGTISQALALGKPLLVMPRLSSHGELVNDHQLATARHFEAGGHLLVAHDGDDVAALLERLRRFEPRPRVAEPERVARRVGDYIDSIGKRRTR